MGLREIRHQVAKLCLRLLAGTVDGVPVWNQLCEFDRGATARDRGKSEGFARGISPSGEFREQFDASFASTQRRADIRADKCLSASDVARILGPDSSAAISNVLVLGTENCTPLKRMEIRLKDPKDVPATLNLLAVELQRSGIELRAVWHPGIPATEIWLTSPLHDRNKTLLSRAASFRFEADQSVAAKAGSPPNQAQ
jgi:hypothetical protein